MAEAAKGGWVRRAATSTASVRPWAAAIATVSAATGRAMPARTRASASSTGSRLMASRPRLVDAGAPAALRQQPHAFDAHGAVGGLHHVVDRQAGDRDRGQRLHLDPGRA